MDWESHDTESDLSGLTVHLKLTQAWDGVGFRSASEAEKAQTLLKEHGAMLRESLPILLTADEESDSYFKQQLECFKGIPRWFARSTKIRSC